jgi:hypothetical protein
LDATCHRLRDAAIRGLLANKPGDFYTDIRTLLACLDSLAVGGILAEQLGRGSSARLILAIDIGQRLLIAIPHDETRGCFLDYPGRREATFRQFSGPNPLRTRVLLPALSTARVGLWIASRARGCVSIRIDVVEDVAIPEATRLLPQAVWRERRTLADAAYDRGVAILGLNGVAHSLGAAATCKPPPRWRNQPPPVLRRIELAGCTAQPRIALAFYRDRILGLPRAMAGHLRTWSGHKNDAEAPF